MKISEAQKQIDDWIQTYGVRYFDEMTNTVILAEELGEFSRLMARQYGEQSFKKEVSSDSIKEQISDEMADMLFVIMCLANQMDIDLELSLKKNLDKKTKRDNKRHIENKKLKDK